jgi:hypothetical protein
MTLRMLTNLRLADLRLTTAQQRSTGQNLPSELYHLCLVYVWNSQFLMLHKVESGKELLSAACLTALPVSTLHTIRWWDSGVIWKDDILCICLWGLTKTTNDLGQGSWYLGRGRYIETIPCGK